MYETFGVPSRAQVAITAGTAPSRQARIELSDSDMLSP
jgi:hypothetical protein